MAGPFVSVAPPADQVMLPQAPRLGFERSTATTTHKNLPIHRAYVKSSAMLPSLIVAAVQRAIQLF